MDEIIEFEHWRVRVTEAGAAFGMQLQSLRGLGPAFPLFLHTPNLDYLLTFSFMCPLHSAIQIMGGPIPLIS